MKPRFFESRVPRGRAPLAQTARPVVWKNAPGRRSLTAAGLALALAGDSAADAKAPAAAATTAASAAAPAAPAAPRGDVAAGTLRALDEKIAKLGGKLGASVSDAQGTELAELGGARPTNPASNAKLVTAAAALSILGAEHRFFTGLYGRREGARVDPLVLRGKGDPLLGTEDLRALGHALAVAGVREVGDIVVDQSHFDGRFVPPAFEQQPDEWAPFRAPVSAVALDRNVVTLWIRPGEEGKSAALVSDPAGFIEVAGTIKTGKKGSPEKVSVELSQKGDHLVARVDGSVPPGERPIPAIRRADDPRALPGYALRAVLREQGLKVGGAVRVERSGEKRLLAGHSSPPLAEILPRMGKDSDNFVAEMVFLALGAGEKGADHERATAAVEGFLREQRLWAEGTVIKNGSGLFDADRVSASQLARLVAAASASPSTGPEFVAQLAVAGVDGTLKNRMEAWAKRRAIRAKTGTLAKNIALSGVILDRRGTPALAFSFLVEGSAKAAEVKKALDGAAEALASEVWR